MSEQEQLFNGIKGVVSPEIRASMQKLQIDLGKLPTNEKDETIDRFMKRAQFAAENPIMAAIPDGLNCLAADLGHKSSEVDCLGARAGASFQSNMKGRQK